MVKLLRVSVVALLAGVVLTGCSDGTTTVSNAASSPSSQLATAPPPSLTASSSTAPLLPSPLDTYCDGVTSTADANYLINSGAAVALVKFSLLNAGLSLPAGAQLPAKTVTVLAGSLPNGPITELTQIGESVNSVTMPSDDYVALIGSNPVAGSYYLADGLRGVFLDQASTLAQLCPNPPGPPNLKETGSVDAVTAFFQAAFSAR